MRTPCWLTLAGLIASGALVVGLPASARAEGFEIPRLIDVVRSSSVFVVRSGRPDVRREETPETRTTWHVFRIEETLSTASRTVPDAAAAVVCGASPKPDLDVAPGEIAVPFTGGTVDSDVVSHLPRHWEDFKPQASRRYLVIVSECGGVGHLPYGPGHGFFEVQADGRLVPGVEGVELASEFDSIDEMKRLIADIAIAVGDSRPSALIVGRTVDAITGQPVGDTLVRLDGFVDRYIRSTADGWFFFRDLPAFTYALLPSKEGWFVEESDAASRRVPLAPGERRGDMLLRLHHAPEVQGTVRDEAGRPVIAAKVTLYRLSKGRDDRRKMRAAADTQTDDRGRFSLAIRTPGDYIVAAGVFPLAEHTQDPERLFYPETFYPDAVAPAEATVLTLGGDEPPRELDVQMRATRARRIGGTVRYAGSAAPGAILRLDRFDPIFEIDRTTGGFGSLTFRPASDGSFTIDRLVPGEYIMSVVRKGEPPDAWINKRVTLRDRDVVDVEIELSEAFKPAPPSWAPAAAAPPDGSSAIEGVVRDTDGGGPLNRTMVTLRNLSGRAGRVLETDAAGRFAFTGLASGRYRLSIARDGYLPAGSDATPPGEADVTVAAGETRIVSPSMSRAGAIAGAVFDTNGAPMRGMSVELRRYTSRDGTPAIAKMPRILMVVGGVLRTGLTDEQGRYRIFGIPPGDYVVVAAWPPGDSGAATATPEDVARARADARAGSSQPQGGEAGRIGSIGGKAAPTPAVPLADPALEVFYPGTTNPSNAERVHISTGSDIPNRDIHLVAERGARVTGTVRLESGTVKWNWSIALARTDIVVEQHPTFRELDRFTASNLPAGRYAIIGRTWSATRDPETHLWGRTDVEVGTDDIDGVELVLRPTAFLRARVVVGDGNSQPGSTPLLVRLERADPGYPPDQLGFTNVGVSRVEADGTLTLVGIAPGRYRLALVDGSGESVPWVVRSISIDGVDLVDNILDVARGGSLGDAVIRVGAR